MLETKRREDMQYPALHLNGSGATNLLEGYSKAHNAILDAKQALAQTAPHMRDYYVLPNAHLAYNDAIAQHNERLQKLTDVQLELEQLAQSVSTRDAERRSR